LENRRFYVKKPNAVRRKFFLDWNIMEEKKTVRLTETVQSAG
jgi:hypothetical protein